MASYRIAAVVALSSIVAVHSATSTGYGLRSATSTKSGEVQSCSSSDVSKQLAACLQGLTNELKGVLSKNKGGDVCASWSSFECCMTDSFSSCNAATKKSVADKVAMQKSTFEEINPSLKSCTANCAVSESTPDVTPRASSKDGAVQGCSSSDVTKQLTTCLQGFTGTLASGDVCGSWSTFECCMTNGFSSCSAATKKSVADKVAMQKSTFGTINPTLNSCTANCAGGGSTPVAPPAEVETTLMASIMISNPLAFNVSQYVEAVKKSTGVAQLPEAVVKAFEIAVTYVLPDATVMATVKAAIAKANDVLGDQVQVVQSSSRRLSDGDGSDSIRRLNVNVDVLITVPDKSKAAAVQTSAANTTVLESEIGGAVSVQKAPVTTVKVETKVKSAPSATGQLVSQIKGAASNVDGYIQAEVKEAAPLINSNRAASKFRIVLAAVLVLLRPVL